MIRPYEWYWETAAKYGRTFSARAMNGDLVITSDPALVQKFFAASEDEAGPFAVEAAGPVLGFHSVMLTGGEEHRRMRRLLMPAFSGEGMRSWGQRMRDITAEQSAAWPGRGAFPSHEAMLEISLQIIVELIFGARTPDEVKALSGRTEELMGLLKPVMLFSRAFQTSVFGMGPWARFVKARDGFRSMLLRQVAARREEGLADGTDMLALLMGARDEQGAPMSDEELVDQLVALLVAGHETTSIALSWALYWLHRHPETLARLRAELDACPDVATTDLSTLPWLGMVVKETLRLWPIVPDMLRTVRRDYALGEWKVPAGMCMAVSAAVTHYDPELYPEPESFRPERFETFHPRPWEYFPFGGGVRRCVGASFATFEMAQVLGTLIHRLDFELVEAGEVRPVRRNITMAPRGGVPVRCRPRA
jgi:cytochrome P450